MRQLNTSYKTMSETISLLVML